MKYTFLVQHALGGTNHGFPAFLEDVLSNLNASRTSFNLTVDNVVSNETNAVVFCTFTPDGELKGMEYILSSSRTNYNLISISIGMSNIGANVVKSDQYLIHLSGDQPIHTNRAQRGRTGCRSFFN